MFSYWEQKDFSSYDTVIIGAGLAGLFSAVFLKQQFAKQSVLVLDKDMFPAASTKNAGFACMGSLTELEDDLQNSTAEEVAILFEKRWQGLKILREELGDGAISYQEEGSYELLYEKDENVLVKMNDWNKLLFSIQNKNAFATAEISSWSFDGFRAMIKNELEGALDTGKMYRSLKEKAQSLGVEILMNTPVTSFEKKKDGFKIRTENGFLFQANRLILCTNAFTHQYDKSLKITPARGQVLLAKPSKPVDFKGIYHFDRGYYYFRTIDDYILFGGGRNLDKETETTAHLGRNETILKDLEAKLKEQILPDQSFEIVQSWSGIMGMTKSKNPIIQQLEEDLYVLAGFGGMGVALAPQAAKELAQKIIQ